MELPTDNQYDILGTIKNYGLLNQATPREFGPNQSAGLMQNIQKAGEDLAAAREKQRKDSQDRFKTMVELGDYEGAKQNFVTGYLGEYAQMSPEQEQEFKQNFDLSRQQKRNEVYQTQLSDAQKRGDAETIIKLTEQIFGQPLDESRKENIRRTSQVARIKETSSIVEDLKSSPPTVSYPIVAQTLTAAGLPVPSYEDYLKTYYAPRVGTSSTADQRQTEFYVKTQTDLIKNQKDIAVKAIGGYSSATKDQGGAARQYLNAVNDQESALNDLQSAYFSNDAGIIENARRNYVDKQSKTNRAVAAFNQSLTTAGQATLGQGRLEVAQGGLQVQQGSLAVRQRLADAQVRKINTLLPLQEANLKSTIKSRLEMLAPRLKLAESQAQLNQYLQSNSRDIWQRALSMTSTQETQLIMNGSNTPEELDQTRDARIRAAVDSILKVDTRLKELGVMKKFTSTEANRKTAAELKNRARPGSLLDTREGRGLSGKLQSNVAAQKPKP
jgi:hypothetical protein